MAFVDDVENKFIVRVVYDGPARAGKTTNLKTLCQVFSVARRSELLSPEQTAGRTTYFDWLQVDSGVIAGSGLRTVFLTVPGQRVLSSRRFALLELADVVAFVVDGQGTLDEAIQMFRVLKVRIAQDDFPPALVVQINKHDLPGSHDEAKIRSALDLDPKTPVVAASALDGTGVRETAVLTMRAGADRVQRLLRRGREKMDRGRYDAIALRAMIDEREVGKRYAPVAALRDMETRLNTDPPPTIESVFSRNEKLGNQTPWTLVTLPQPDVPSGCIWPASGRTILRKLDREHAVFRVDLCSNTGMGDGSGSTDTIIVRAGDYCLKTSHRRFCVDDETAKAKLLLLARSKVMLKDLIPSETVVSIQKAERGGYYVWTTTQWLPTLRHLMTNAVDEKDEGALSEALLHYAKASLVAAQLATRSGIILDVHPSNFGLEGNKLCYLDDDVGVGTLMPTFGYSILRRVEEYAKHPPCVEAYLSEIERSFAAALDNDERRALDLVPLLRDTLVTSVTAEKAKQRLLQALSS